MFRHPVVVGGGTPFLAVVTEDVPLDLIETRTLGSRAIYERYGRAQRKSDLRRLPTRESSNPSPDRVLADVGERLGLLRQPHGFEGSGSGGRRLQ